MTPATPDNFTTPVLAVSNITGTSASTVTWGERSFAVTLTTPIAASASADLATAMGSWSWNVAPAPGLSLYRVRHWVWGTHAGQGQVTWGTAGTSPALSGALALVGGSGPYAASFTWFVPPGAHAATTDLWASLQATTILPPGVPGTLLTINGFGVEYLQPIPGPGALAAIGLFALARRRR